MFHLKLLIGAALLGAVLVPAGGAVASYACQDGVTSGQWDLPSGSSSFGFLSGKLADPTGTYGIYAIDAVLVDDPSPCLSCVTGAIYGTVDDGIGPGPDYYLVGGYSGIFFTGQGTFAAKIVPSLFLFFKQPPLDHRLRGNACMIGARHPERVVPLHPLEADHDVLERVIERMPQV